MVRQVTYFKILSAMLLPNQSSNNFQELYMKL